MDTNTLVVLSIVCAVATAGVAASDYGTTAIASNDDQNTAVTDRTVTEPRDSASSIDGEARAQQQTDGPVHIEPGETVTDDLQNRSGFVFDIEPGETATIEYRWEAAEESGENVTAIEAQMPDGRIIPERSTPPTLLVDSGETITLNVTTKKAGQAKINIDTDILHAASEARGTFELSLSIEQTGEVPDEPNDDRANATKIELNTRKSAELDGAEVDYYVFSLPDYRTDDYPRNVEVPVTVTVERERQDGVSVLNVDTAPAGQPSDTTTRYVGTSNPTRVRFVGTDGEQYYVSVTNVNEGGGPYNLIVQVNESAISEDPEAPENETQALDEIALTAYGIPFDELSEPTSQLVRAVYDHQNSETKLSRDELAQMRYDMSFEDLSEETRAEITTLYWAQFVDGQV